VTIPLVLIAVAFILAAIDQIRARGQSLTGWAVIFIAIALLWGRLDL
jgi:hypothetical protein